MTPSIFQMKQEMCEVGYRIWHKGFCAGNEGNHSVRIGEDRVLCTPTGLSKGFLKPDMITLVDMDGKQIDTDNKYKRTSEILLHLQIYKKRPDVKAVIHSHPPHATAFACAGVPIPEGVHPEAEVFLGKVPTAKYTTPSYAELGKSVCDLIGPETNTVLMGNHGSVSFSPTLIDTYYKLEILDAYCRILLLIKQVGRVNFLSQQEMIDLLKVKQKFGIPDARLACAPTGCIGSDNQPYLSTFQDATVASAQCDCENGNVVKPAGVDGAAFDALVKMVTDQIVAGLKK
ncbi:MAG TPA: class II aldolase/adducin family protein [Phycisphaerae bacterium]|nr:class II aldolase/adducin family protein [Phycisphaerae bacterium]